MTSRNFSLTTAFVFALIAFMQFAQSVFGWPVIVGTHAMPQWFSWVAFFFAAGLYYFGWRAYAATK